MVTDVTDINSAIRGYIVNNIKQFYPDIDTSENSVYDDMFIKPLINLVGPFVDALSRVELKSNLANAPYLTEEELDEVGQGNYFIERKEGVAATTSLTLTFANINIEDPDFVIKVPSGATFSTSSGLEFQTQNLISLTADDLRVGYNKERLVYEIDIPIIAIEPGTKYNVYAGEIMYNNTYFSSSLMSVINKADVVNGKDKESNEDYYERIKEFYISRQLGTAPGYKNFVRDMFEEITDVYVSGYKDPYMERDKIKVWNDETSKVEEKHVGGAVDLHLKGCLFDDGGNDVTLNNNIIVLSETEFGSLVDTATPTNSVEVFNLSDSTKRPVIKSVTAASQSEFNGVYVDKVKVVIDNTEDVSYDSTVLNNMKLIYRFNDEDGSPLSQELYFQAGISEVELAGPVKSVDALLDSEQTPIADFENRIEVIKTGLADTTDEKCVVRIKNCDDYPNGSILRVKYTSNKTLRQLKDVLIAEQYRIITADVIAKEANAVPVNVQFKFKTTGTYKNVDATILQTRMKSSVISFFSQYKLGDSIEESDIVGWLYSDPSVKDLIQYVALPFDVFYIPKDINEEIPSDGSEHSENGVLPIRAIDYPILNANKFNVEIMY